MKNGHRIINRRRWPWPQRLKNAALYGLMRGGLTAAQLLPLRGLMRLAGCLAPYLFRSHARRARAQLTVALPELEPAKTTRRMFVHFAESIWELSRLHRRVPPLDPAARRVLDEVLSEGKGAITISGHIGNWELLGQSIAAAGYPIATVAKPFYDPRITRWLHKWRTVHGLQIIWRDRSNTGRSILRVLRQNGLMAFLIDQDTKTPGDFVPFFGRPAFTPTVPAALALRTGSPVIFCWHHRRGKRHRITIERLHYLPTGDTKRDVLALTAMLNERLESIIRAAPEQWVWLHKRWHTRLARRQSRLG
ncbi:MAG: lysophospholipid acyltransferase family protein [Candidatus Binatia bacterium]